MSGNIVEDWLKSLELGKYAQSFLDNGYDDLEICKQIGNLDLDAIGVNKPSERKKLLDAVKVLNEQGGTAVYLTLEEHPSPKDDMPSYNNSSSSSGTSGTHDGTIKGSNDPKTPTTTTTTSTTQSQDVAYPTGSAPPVGEGEGGYPVPPPPPPQPQPQLVAYPKLKLTMILREKLTEEGIDLANPPYTGQNLSPSWSGLTALAVKYAQDMKTYVEDILECLEDLRWWKITEDTTSIYTPPSMTSSTHEDPYYGHSLYTGSPRGGPPPIPSVPPPDSSHTAYYGEMTSVNTRYGSPSILNNYVTLDTGMCCVFPKKMTKAQDGEKKKTSTLGRLFRNIGFRRSSRKHSYKQHQGDLIAHEITMGDNDRIALMQMVKEGKITTETALQVVKRFEEERKRDSPFHDADKKGHQGRSKKSSNKPTKSPSVMLSDFDGRCEICNNILSNNCAVAGGNTWRDHIDCCRHKRVHSVSHIAYSDPMKSPETARAVSCSPMRSQSTQPSTLNSPVGYAAPGHMSKIYTPVIPHELKMYSGNHALYAVHGIDVLRDRLNVIKTSACVHKTPSKASLISSESDHSMECANMHANHVEFTSGQRGEDPYYCCNSAVSVGSDTSPGNNGRRKCGSTMEKLRNYKWQRTGSVGMGEDGMSTDNDDHDDPDRRLLGPSQSGGIGLSHVSEKFRDVRNEIRKRILLQTRGGDSSGDSKGAGTSHSVSSTDSCHSGSSGHGSQYSAAPTEGHLPANMEGEIVGTLVGPIVGHARVHSNYSPGPEEREFLYLRRGDRVQILEINNSGIWRGIINNRIGFFRYSYVDMVTETTPLSQRKERSRRRMNRRSKPRSVDELLIRIGLEHLTNIFLLNGYDNLEIFAEIDNSDLNALQIHDAEARAKVLTAAELLMDYEALDIPEEIPRGGSRSASATPTCLSQGTPLHSSYLPKPYPGNRDSGCYDSNEYLMQKELAEVYSSGKYRTTNHDNNKENHRPHLLSKKGMKMGLKHQSTPDSGEQVKMQNSVSQAVRQDVRRPDRIFTEEDKEVCDITYGYHGNAEKTPMRLPSAPPLIGSQESPLDGVHVQHRTFNLNILPAGQEWRYFSNAFTQTSTKYAKPSNFAVDTDLNGLSAMSNSISGDLSGIQLSNYKIKSKPFPRKVRSASTPVKDAQVQVMCPLGSFPQPPPIPSTIPGAPLTTQSEAGHGQEVVNSKQEVAQTVSLMYIGQQTGPARLSYTSQTSKENDSGSDTSTVKSDKFQENGGTDSRGRNTPDSLYGHVHKGFKSIKRSLIPRVTSKLAAESIDLATEPYTSASGVCGIPPLLVQRYAEELKQDLYRIALILDQVRIHKLTTLGLPVVPAEQLAETSSSSSELKISSVPEFFISIGLPMYAEPLLSEGYTCVDELAVLPIKDLQSMTQADKKHMKRMIHALEWVQNKLSSPTRVAKVSPVKDKV